MDGGLSSRLGGLLRDVAAINQRNITPIANCQLPIASYLTEVVLSSAQDKVVLWPIIDRFVD